MRPRTILARNPGPLTLSGTQTYIVGQERVAIIDPGPFLEEHIHAVVDAVGNGVAVGVLVTHSHPDHDENANELANRLNTSVRAFERGTLRESDVIATDHGNLVALYTPGHRQDHFGFQWDDAVFCGDLMMGGQNTALVAPPEGDLRDYLASLNRVRSLRPHVIYPAHGPAIENPDEAIAEYIAHREDRLRQVRGAMASGATSASGIVDVVYGAALHPQLRAAALGATQAYLTYIENEN